MLLASTIGEQGRPSFSSRLFPSPGSQPVGAVPAGLISLERVIVHRAEHRSVGILGNRCYQKQFLNSFDNNSAKFRAQTREGAGLLDPGENAPGVEQVGKNV